jgi:hypothetical protein
MSAAAGVAGFSTTDDQFTAHELLVVEFGYGAFCLVDCVHRHECEALRVLRVPMAYDFRVVDLADAVEEVEQIALGRIEREVADV